MLFKHVFSLFSVVFAISGLFAAEEVPLSPWPLDVPYGSGVITLYQPQPEKLDGNVLTARAAASYLANGKSEDERVFGALWFTAKLDIDRENDVAKARSMTITKVMTPKGEKTADEGAAARKAIQDAVVAKGLELDLDRLNATLEEPANAGSADFSPAVPRIRIRQEPTLLVVLDGAPKQQEVNGVQRVINTPAFIAIDSDGVWWLRGDTDWLTAPGIDGPWTIPTSSPQTMIVDSAKQAGYPTSVVRIGAGKPPAVIIAQEPTELVVFAGKPVFEPIGDGALQGATNTDSTALVEVASKAQYLLVAGRWYTAAQLTDKAQWTLVEPQDLPSAFAAIPDTSAWKDVLAHVPGTQQADEAVAQQQLPQTARIPRTASISVAFDGAPKWVQVTGLAVEYAENSADAVFRLPGEIYFVCRDGVWYDGKSPAGPYTVATSVPDALRNLPADCPWYNTSYVTVYESTPEYVWCGYTPGYMGWYCHGGCPIYGTGFWYRCWYGRHVYPRPVTWGVGIRYNQWSGWGVNAGTSGSHLAVGWPVNGGGNNGNGWWGSGGVNTTNSGTISLNNRTVNIGNGSLGSTDRPLVSPAIYDRVPGAERPKLQEVGQRLRGGASGTPAAGTQSRRENLAVDRDGTIARPTANGAWQTRVDGAWKDRPTPVVTPAGQQLKPGSTVNKPTPPVTRPAPSLERTQQQRASGEQRVQQRAAPPPNRGGSGGGGGGGARR